MAVNKELATAIKKAKTSRMMFAFVAKGTEGSLLVDRRIPPKDIAEAKKELGGGTVYKGKCFGEDGEMVFEMTKEPPSTLANLLKRHIMKEAGLSLKVEVRIAADADDETEDVEGEEEQTAASAEIPEAPPLPPTEKADESAAFAAKLKAVLPAYQKAVQAVEGKRLKILQSVFAAIQNGVKARDFNVANSNLKMLVEVLAGKMPIVEDDEEETEDPAPFKNKLKQLMPLYEKFKGSAPGLPALMAQAMTAAKENRFSDGLELLDQIVAAIKTASNIPARSAEDSRPSEKTNEGPKVAPAKGKLVQYRQALLRWDQARKKALSAVQELQKAIAEEFPESAGEVGAVEEVMGRFNGELEDAIDAALNAADEDKRTKHHREALKVIRAYAAYVNGDPRIQAIDGENPFDTAPIGEPLLDALGDLESMLEE